jgi:hypothetical protein
VFGKEDMTIRDVLISLYCEGYKKGKKKKAQLSEDIDIAMQELARILGENLLKE